MKRLNGQLYKVLFENLIAGFAHCEAIYDEHGHMVDWKYLQVNRAFEDNIGLKDVVGKRVTELLPKIYETNRKSFDNYEQIAKGNVRFGDYEVYVPQMNAWLFIHVYSVEPDTFTILFRNINEQKNHLMELEKANLEILLALVRMLKFRDDETDKHSERVTELFLRLGEKLGGMDMELEYRGALLHDIGKMFVPDNILRKPGKLTAGETTIMKLHPQNAYDLLSPIRYLEKCLDIPYCHHEKWDGSGYPNALQGSNIHIYGRITALADVFDALSCERVYKKAWPMEQIIDFVSQERGRHFDPDLVDMFMENIDRFKEIATKYQD